MRRRKLSAEALDVLGSMQFEGKLARITAGRLSRSLYLEVNECLMALGGRWTRKLGSHVFDDDPRDALDQVLLTGGDFSNRRQDFGFFETPGAIADSVVRAAVIEPGHRVLEPSAGRGALLRALAMHIPTKKIQLTAIELMPENCRALVAAGWGKHVIETDFLLYAEAQFDRIIMNAPFARQADIDHVAHAYKLLVEGGRLVAIMAAGIKFRRNRKTDALRALIEAQGAMHDLPDGAFHESGTDVRTVLVTIDKSSGGEVHCARGAECQS